MSNVLGSTCEVCGIRQTVTTYCVVVGDFHATYGSDFEPTRTVIREASDQ